MNENVLIKKAEYAPNRLGFAALAFGLGGEILLASNDGEGCHFHIELPLHKEKAA